MKHELRQMERQGGGAIVNKRLGRRVDWQPRHRFLHCLQARPRQGSRNYASAMPDVLSNFGRLNRKRRRAAWPNESPKPVHGDESVSVAFEEISAKNRKDKVYKSGILSQPEKLYKKPGYTM
jgi:hypothetical protein